MVHNVQAEDAGIYFCFAKTNSGTVFQKAVLEFVPLKQTHSKKPYIKYFAGYT